MGTRKPHTVHLTPEGQKALRERAATHGVSMSAYVDALVQGCIPGGTRGGDAYEADGWWFELVPKARRGIYEWLGKGKKRKTLDVPGQLTIFEGDPT